MSEILTSFDHAVTSLSRSEWDAGKQNSVVKDLEQGKVIFLPHLAFSLSEREEQLLDPVWVDPKRKNISYQPLQDKLTGIANNGQETAIRELLKRHYHSCRQLVAGILPEYQTALHTPTNSLRLHPITGWTQNSSWRKDDSRLHVDAFPSRPNYGERILRIFTNINPYGESRNWRVGESFPALAERFLPHLKNYSSLRSWLQKTVGITKSYRSHYDHLMLQIHDAMKADIDYQKNGSQIAIEFPQGSSWMCFSDQTPHAAMSGQFMLEQTFLLPVNDMHNPQQSPLKVLESLTNKVLI